MPVNQVILPLKDRNSDVYRIIDMYRFAFPVLAAETSCVSLCPTKILLYFLRFCSTCYFTEETPMDLVRPKKESRAKKLYFVSFNLEKTRRLLFAVNRLFLKIRNNKRTRMAGVVHSKSLFQQRKITPCSHHRVFFTERLVGSFLSPFSTPNFADCGIISVRALMVSTRGDKNRIQKKQERYLGNQCVKKCSSTVR